MRKSGFLLYFITSGIIDSKGLSVRSAVGFEVVVAVGELLEE